MIKYRESHYQIVWWIGFIAIFFGGNAYDHGDKLLAIFLALSGLTMISILRIREFVEIGYDTQMYLATSIMIFGTFVIINSSKLAAMIPAQYQNAAELVGWGTMGVFVGVMFASLIRALFLKDQDDDMVNE